MTIKLGHALLALVVIGLFVLSLPSLGVDIDFSKLWQSADSGETETDTASQDTASDAMTEDSEQVSTTDTGVTEIYAISSVNFKPTLTDMLNETAQNINPTFYLWQEGQIEPATVTISGGVPSSTQAVTPNQKITWAAGTTGTYYWEKGTVQIGWKDKPVSIKLYSVAIQGEVTVDMYKDFTKLDEGASNTTVGSGETVNLQMLIDVTGEYSVIRNPYICMDYNATEVKRVKISGLLEEGSVPTRLISGLDQCFDTGIEFYEYGDPQLNYDIQVQHISGQNPAATNDNSRIIWYIIDKDKYYQNGKMYFTNPIDMTNMGADDQWNVTTYFA